MPLPGCPEVSTKNRYAPQEDSPVAAGHDGGTRARTVCKLEEPGHLGNGSPTGAVGESVVAKSSLVPATNALDPDVSAAVLGLEGGADAGAQSALGIS